MNSGIRSWIAPSISLSWDDMLNLFQGCVTIWGWYANCQEVKAEIDACNWDDRWRYYSSGFKCLSWNYAEFRPLLLLCSLFLQYIYTDNENIKSPHREVKPKMIKIRATKCKLKQMGPKYLSVSFSLSRRWQVSDLALLLSKEIVTFLMTHILGIFT